MSGSLLRSVAAVAVGMFVLATSETLAAQSGGSNNGNTTAAAKPAAKPAMRKPKPSQAVKLIQAALNRHGAKLRVDGFMGPKTRTALKQFQAENGLPRNGKADRATRAKLGV